MKTKQEKIDAIYEKIANKDLSFGCIVKWEEAKYRILKAIQPHRFEAITTWYIWYGDYGSVVLTPISEYEIIGHPVMIGDVMDYIENITLDKIYNYIWVKKEEIPDLILQKTKDARMKIFPLWKQKRLPIEEQSDECIDFIFDLLNK